MSGGQKWLRAGRGTNFLVMSDRALERIEPVLSGWLDEPADFLETAGAGGVPDVPEPTRAVASFAISRPRPTAQARLATALERLDVVGIDEVEAGLRERVDQVLAVIDEFGLPVISPRAADERAEHILDISRERWLQEMNKLLLGSEVEAALEFLADVRILGVILPELAGLKTLGGPWSDAMRLVSGAPPELSQRWASVLFSVGAFWARERPGPHAAMMVEGIAKRLTFDNALSLEIRTILAQHQTLTASTSEWTDAAIRRMVRELDPFCAQTLRFARHVDQILGSGDRKEWLGDFET